MAALDDGLFHSAFEEDESDDSSSSPTEFPLPDVKAEKFVLFGKRVSSDEGKQFLQALKKNEMLTSLTLHSSGFDNPKQLDALLELLGPEYRSLERLDLFDIALTETNVETLIGLIADAFATLHSLTIHGCLLNLTKNTDRISDVSAHLVTRLLKNIFRHPSLHELTISGNKLGDSFITETLPVLHENNKLISLNIGNNELDNNSFKAIAKLLKANQTLEVLSVVQLKKKIANEVYAELAAAIKENPELREFNIAASCVNETQYPLFEGIEAVNFKS